MGVRNAKGVRNTKGRERDLENERDAEMKIYISGNPVPFQREFRRGTDIIGVQKILAQFILK
jgi:hypothetical protein